MFSNIVKVIQTFSPKPRKLSSLKPQENLHKTRIQAWQVHSYGEDLQNTTTRMPQIQDPNEILVQVEAASINPIDLLMSGGYGRTLFQLVRRYEMELPLTLGRDFAGTVVYKGHLVDKLKVGDKVYGFIPLHKSGSFSEVIVADQHHVCPQPSLLTPVESASVVYASMTAWSALYLFGNLANTQVSGTRVLILGASGGVGTVAVQMLKSQGSHVYGTCSTDAIPLVQSLGADCVFDYKDPDYLKNVAEEGFFHIILDCAKFGYENVPKNWKFGTYLTLNSPLLLNTDKLGLVPGLLASASTFLKANVERATDGKCVRWAFFTPSSTGLKFVNNLVEQQKICPMIHKEFTFEQLPEALQEVSKGHLRGKVVVKF